MGQFISLAIQVKNGKHLVNLYLILHKASPSHYRWIILLSIINIKSKASLCQVEGISSSRKEQAGFKFSIFDPVSPFSIWQKNILEHSRIFYSIQNAVFSSIEYFWWCLSFIMLHKDTLHKSTVPSYLKFPLQKQLIKTLSFLSSYYFNVYPPLNTIFTLFC